MSKGLQWVIGICFVLVAAAIVFSIVAPVFMPRVGLALSGASPQFGGGRGYGFGGPGYMFGGRGMMGGMRMPFWGLAMIIVALVIVGLIVLVVVLFTRKSPAPVPAPVVVPPAPAAPAPATTPCAHCGQPLEAGWKACPYCGERI